MFWRKKYKPKSFEPMSVVVFEPGNDPETSCYGEDYPLKKGDLCIFLGEIPQARGHCVIAKCASNHEKIGDCPVYWMFHTDIFRLPTEEEF